MAKRSVFLAKETYPFFEEIYVEFDWFGGFALSQKRKSMLGLHLNFNTVYPNKVLEISSASTDKQGIKLSAMNLRKSTLSGETSVESAFQSSRIYQTPTRQLGPFTQCLFLEGKDCKLTVKELSQGYISKDYLFDNLKFKAPDFHISLFYDYLYLNALLEQQNRSAMEPLLSLRYTAFSDLATKALNSQARSCAIFVGLLKADKLSYLQDYDSFLRLFRVHRGTLDAIGIESYENVQRLTKNCKEVELLSPVVKMVYNADYIESHYTKHYSHLTNKRLDVFESYSVYDVDLNNIKELSSLYLKGTNNLLGFRLTDTRYKSLDIACSLLPFNLKTQDRTDLEKYNNEYLSRSEILSKVRIPSLNSLNTDIIQAINNRYNFT